MQEITRRICVAGLAASVARPAWSNVVIPISFDALSGWSADDHEAAFSTWRNSCKRIGGPDLCRREAASPKAFFETYFEPVVIGNPSDCLFTGYYEPVIAASRTRSAAFPVPIYRKPPDLVPGTRYLSRAEIETGGLDGRGLELYWLANPVDRYFLQIQGSGRLRLEDGSLIRVGYAAKNGHPYVSIGKIFNQMKAAAPGTYGAAPLRAWLKRNPVDGAALMQRNPSFVFFTERKDLHPDEGPVGAMGIPLTAERSIAVDPEVNELGMPVWVETEASTGPIRRLMIAQDTGSAIKGAQRGDLFFGTGDMAGKIAGRMSTGGRMVSLIPTPELRRLLSSK
ncbi:MAG: MltA domain-containing protein [Pseudomonadota bacterium]